MPNIGKRVSEDGIFILGLTDQKPSEENMKTFLTPFFKDICINENKYPTDKSLFPIQYIITAKPKLPAEIPQS